MPIIYSVVARGTILLAEHAAASGTFREVTKKILEKIPPQNNKMSYVYERHIFHYLVDDEITYLCMADEEFGRRTPFAFLEDLKNRFKATYGTRGKTALAMGMQQDFAKTIANLMEFYSFNPSADRISSVRGEIDEVKSVMYSNIDKVLARGEKIELLVDKTENMQQSAVKFKKASTALKRSMWFKNVKLIAVIACLSLIIIYVIAAAICGGLLFDGCRKATSSGGSDASALDTPVLPMLLLTLLFVLFTQ